MRTDRVILHCDLNNFYASVELLLHPELAGKPVAVAGDPEKRHGIILAKNYEAKHYGVQTAETIWQAKRKCPDLILVSPHHKLYAEYSKRVKAIYLDYTPDVESFGLDECWLDVTESRRLFGTGEQIANAIRLRVKQETGLTVSVGVSFTKVFAKLGSDYKKPDAVTVFSRENYRSVVWALPVESMLFVGANTCKKLEQLNIHTIGDLARCDEKLLVARFGKVGSTLHSHANGIETEGVKAGGDWVPESVGHGTTTQQDIDNLWDASAVIYALSEMVAFRLRRYQRVAAGVAVGVRDAQLNGFSRQAPLSVTDSAEEISRAAVDLLARSYDFSSKPPLRTITVSVFRLMQAGDFFQPNFFQQDPEKRERIGAQIDKLRDKYGYGVIRRGISLDSVFSVDEGDADPDDVPFRRN